MFWNNIAVVYDLFVNVINRKTHKALRTIVSGLINPGDEVLECACGTGMLSAVIAEKCASLTATDFAPNMLKKAARNCTKYKNIRFEQADINSLGFPSACFDKVVAGNVLHLLDEPSAALAELDRVCRPGGTLIIPTYMNWDREGRNSSFSSAVGKAGADFKRQFTCGSYRQFFIDAGYPDVQIAVAEGRIPCAVAVMKKKRQNNKG